MIPTYGAIDAQAAAFEDVAQFVPNARRFHEALVSRCGNEPMILVIGALELIWSAHESAVWSDAELTPGATSRQATRRAALRDHQRLLDAIRDGNVERASGSPASISPQTAGRRSPWDKNH